MSKQRFPEEFKTEPVKQITERGHKVSVLAVLRNGRFQLTLLLVGFFVCMHFGYALPYLGRLIARETSGNCWSH